jgi:predicted enzyme related to lactoylglutathione lyase
MATKEKNPFTWIEIYVDDMSRARKFYEAVLNIKMTELPMPKGVDDLQMLSFPSAENEINISGALVKMKSVRQVGISTVPYFACDDCLVEEGRVEKSGGKVLRTKMSLGDYGFCTIVMDTEGNTIGLHSMR